MGLSDVIYYLYRVWCDDVRRMGSSTICLSDPCHIQSEMQMCRLVFLPRFSLRLWIQDGGVRAISRDLESRLSWHAPGRLYWYE